MLPPLDQQLGCLSFAVLVGVTVWVVHALVTRKDGHAREGGHSAALCIAIGAFIGVNVALVAGPGHGLLSVAGGILGGFAVCQRLHRSRSS